MSSTPEPYKRILFLDEAREDLRAIHERSSLVVTEVFRLLKQLDGGSITPTELRNFGKTGELSDCGKIVVIVEGEPEHRIVVRSVGAHFEVIEVVAVEDRPQDLPYLLAGLRLGRISNPVRHSDAQRKVLRVRKLLGRN